METRRQSQQAGRLVALSPQDSATDLSGQHGLSRSSTGQEPETSASAGPQQFKSCLSQLLHLNRCNVQVRSTYPSSGDLHPQNSTSSILPSMDYFNAYSPPPEATTWESESSYLHLDIPKLGFMSPKILASLPNPLSNSPNLPSSSMFSAIGSSLDSDWTSSSFDSLTFSSGPSSAASDQPSFPASAHFTQPQFKQFLDQDDLLSLSPPWSTMQEVLERPTYIASSLDSQHSSFPNQESSWDGFDWTFQAADRDLEPVFHFPERTTTHNSPSPMSIEIPSSQDEQAKAAPPAQAPLTSSYKPDSAKPKQLGTFPADDAFAASLGQLASCSSGKPPYLWWTLIRAAILGSPGGKLQMESLCAEIMEKFPYFGTAKEAKNWKSSIRSVIHTKPCFYKSEDTNKNVWWHVDVNIDPREQRRGMKKRNSIGETKRPSNVSSSRRGSTATSCSTEGDEDAEAETDEEAEWSRLQPGTPAAGVSNRKRRKTS